MRSKYDRLGVYPKLKKYSVHVAREVIEYVEVIVKAKNEEEAHNEALDMVSEAGDDVDWQQSDGNEPGEPYVASCEVES